MSLASVEVECQGRTLCFHGAKDPDEVLDLMRKTRSLYEIEVLESVRKRLQRAPKRGLIIDVGAFIGTHAVYFALFCETSGVIAYEPDARTFGALRSNVARNGVEAVVTCVNKAVGAQHGVCSIVRKDPSNTSANYVLFGAVQDAVHQMDHAGVVTLDDDIAARNCPDPVRLIKIDVEGSEVAVLKGGRAIIARDRPILCVEMLRANRVVQALWLLRSHKYAVFDCIGYAPTYILWNCDEISGLRRNSASLIWIVRAAIPTRFFRSRWYLRRLARAVLAND